MAPAQRFDVIVDFSAYQPGTNVTLVSDFGSGDMAKVMRFVAGAQGDDNSRTGSQPSNLSTQRLPE